MIAGVAAGPVAVTVHVYDPAVVGVPASVPAAVSVRPGGREPAVTAYDDAYVASSCSV